MHVKGVVIFVCSLHYLSVVYSISVHYTPAHCAVYMISVQSTLSLYCLTTLFQYNLHYLYTIYIIFV